jgi:aminoglycoside phosphotransferase (APT) family kinase protein
MRPPSLTRREAELLSTEMLGTAVVRADHVPVGFGNENWRVTDTRGRRFVLKIGPADSAGKWVSAASARALAGSRGVPVPRQVGGVVERDGRVIRVYEWIDGASPLAVADDPQRVHALFADLGATIADLHTIELDCFSSRLDGSAPSFDRWGDYVAHRLQQIRQRCLEHDAPDERTVDRACSAIAVLAEEIGDDVRPTMCHRDLYADNVLVDEDGALAAILDWDMAEAWDPAAEWFKLEFLFFPAFPGSASAFDTAYHAIHPKPPRWAERKALVDLMETLNSVANTQAQGWSGGFATRTRARLDGLLTRHAP